MHNKKAGQVGLLRFFLILKRINKGYISSFFSLSGRVFLLIESAVIASATLIIIHALIG